MVRALADVQVRVVVRMLHPARQSAVAGGGTRGGMGVRLDQRGGVEDHATFNAQRMAM